MLGEKMNKLFETERKFEDWLWNNPDKIGLHSCEYLRVEKWIARQLTVRSGVIDLLGLVGTGLVVVEVKNGPFDARALCQVARYAYDIREIKAFMFDYLPFLDDDINMVVAGYGNISKKTILEAKALNVHLVMFEVQDGNIEDMAWNLPYFSSKPNIFMSKENLFLEYGEYCKKNLSERILSSSSKAKYGMG